MNPFVQVKRSHQHLGQVNFIFLSISLLLKKKKKNQRPNNKDVIKIWCIVLILHVYIVK
jgi:hypothetical protein